MVTVHVLFEIAVPVASAIHSLPHVAIEAKFASAATFAQTNANITVID